MNRDHEIWLYGSRARGAADEASDTDLLAVGGAHAVARARSDFAYPRIAVSHYEWGEIEAMWAYGSLFLHHLKTEGIRLVPPAGIPSRLSRLLGELPPFTRAAYDLVNFRRAAREARRSLADGGWPDLELQVMATVVRHAAILGCYCAGEPDYGRESPFETIARHTGYDGVRVGRLARLATEFRYLPLGDRRWATRTADGLHWLGEVDEFLDALGPVINGYEAVLRAAA
jgi:hypothetical protein